ncbi:MAG: cytochrome b [Burkholderiales bacterium]
MSHSDGRPDHYTRTAVVLHWAIALAVTAQFSWGWYMQSIPKQPPGIRADAFNLHKSVGLTILALMIVRALWRWRHPAPPLPAMPAWQSALARSVHVALYACLFVMPLAGYLGSVWSGYPVKYFGMALPAWGSKDDSLKNAMSLLHFATSWVLLSAVLLHVAGALKHALVDRDGLVSRMGLGWPRAGAAGAIDSRAAPPSP